jgi:hypothetical protein
MSYHFSFVGALSGLVTGFGVETYEVVRQLWEDLEQQARANFKQLYLHTD